MTDLDTTTDVTRDTGGGPRLVLLAEILEHPDNPRRDLGDLTELAASIREQGLLQPIVIAPNTGRKRAPWVCLAGHRRMKAAKKAGLIDVPVVVRSDLNTRALQVAAMVAENLHRADLTPIEEASAYQLLLDDVGLTVKEISTATGRPQATVKSRLKLTRLPEPVQARVATHQITLADAEALADLAVKDPAAAERAGTANGDLRWSIQTEVRMIEERERFDRLFALVDAQSDVPVILAANLGKDWHGYGGGPGPKKVYTAAHYYPPLRQAAAMAGAAEPGPFCPHRVIVVIDTQYELRVSDEYCSDPASHRTADQPAGVTTGEVNDQWRRDRAAFSDAEAIASALRKQWLCEIVAGGGIAADHTSAAVQLLARLNISPVVETGGLAYWHDACSWLRDLPGFPPGDDDELDDYTPVLDALARLTPATTALAVAAALVEADTSSRGLAPLQLRSATPEWVALLDLYGACGYRVSDWETQQLQRARTHHTELDALADVHEPDDDPGDHAGVDDSAADDSEEVTP
jgi:ParB/RepB/Spo0J family partition protein